MTDEIKELEYEWDREEERWRFVGQGADWVIVGQWRPELEVVHIDSATGRSLTGLAERMQSIAKRLIVAELSRLGQEIGGHD